MAKFYVAEGFSIEAGPQIGFLLSAKVDWEEDGDSGTEDIKDEVKGIDFGVNLGFGYKLDSGLNFGARYNLSLTELPDTEFEEVNSLNWKNGVIQAYVGFFF